MSLVLCFTLFIAPLALSQNFPVDPATIEDVFGTPQIYEATQAQAVPVVAPPNTTDTEYVDPLDFVPSAADYDKFDWTLTKRVAAFSDQNFLLSPLGLKLALAILHEAATGATRSELSSVLGFPQDTASVRKKFSTILSSLQTKSSQYILNLGSRIYVETTAEPRQRFAAIAQEFYRTEFKTINFHNAPLAAQEINTWVSNITENRIHNLVAEDDVLGMVILVLNTLYFKGSWLHQFSTNDTKIGSFFISTTEHRLTHYMNTKARFHYAESAKYDAKLLRLPYLGNKFSMYLVVPNSLTGLSRVLTGITELRGEMSNLQERLVDVTLPRFKFDYTSVLDGVLKELGIRQAFEDIASFPGIARGQLLQQRLRISRVLQRSGIEVNEIGSVAYSATEISLVNKFGEDKDVEVVANKPFLFFIEDEETRQLLFTGRVSNPSLADGVFSSTSPKLY